VGAEQRRQLEPAFRRRVRSYVGQTEATEVVVFPVVCLALYSGDELLTVCPSTVGGEHVTVHDCLDALNAGHVERFLTRFTPHRVDRTAPHLDQPTAGGPAGRALILIVVIIFVTTSRERLVRGLKLTNCDSPAVKTHNNQYQKKLSLSRR
jgi:hypothetical protein